MKSNRSIILFGVIFICLCLALLAATGFVYLRNQPPSSLTNPSGYYIRGSKVYYLGGFPSEAFEMSGADASSFKIIDESYGLDNAHVYLDGGLILGADPASFQIIHGNFSKDASYVYLGTDVFSDDPSHFEILSEPLMRDSKHVYWDVKTVSDDPAHLVLISSDSYVYFKDSTTIFVQGNPIAGADPASFSVISDSYAKDNKAIYYFDKAISNVDAASFEVIQSPYSRDAQRVFWMEKPIEGADSGTFQVLNKDFECTSDNTHAYYENMLITNANPSTFPANKTVTNCDLNGVYFSQ